MSTSWKSGDRKGFFTKNKWDSSSVEEKIQRKSTSDKPRSLKSPLHRQKTVDETTTSPRDRDSRKHGSKSSKQSKPIDSDEDEDEKPIDDEEETERERERVKSPEEMMRSKFRKNPRKSKDDSQSQSQKSSSTLTKKMINVWRRDSQRRKTEEKSDDDDDAENSEEEESKPSKPTKLLPIPWGAKSILGRRASAKMHDEENPREREKDRPRDRNRDREKGRTETDRNRNRNQNRSKEKERAKSKHESDDDEDDRGQDNSAFHHDEDIVDMETDKENEQADGRSTPSSKSTSKSKSKAQSRKSRDKTTTSGDEDDKEGVKRDRRSRHFSDGSSKHSEDTKTDADEDLKETERERERQRRVVSRVSSSAVEHESHDESQDEKTSSKMILDDETFRMARHGIPDPNLWNVVSFEKPIHTTESELETWKNMIYYPSSSELSLEDKLPDDLSVRFLEDEGIFVGNPIEMSKRNTRRLEHRILTEKAYEWLGQNGKLISFPSPYRPERIQLYHDEKTSTEMVNSVSFKSAKLEPMQEFQLDPKMLYEIIVDIGSINFKHHPLFSKEHVLAARLETSYEEYNRRKELKLTERLQNKLKALRVALQHCKEEKSIAMQKLKLSMKQKGSGDADYDYDHDHNDHDKSDYKSDEISRLESHIEQLNERIRRYRQEMRKTRVERNQAWKDDKVILTSVLDAWKSLKSLRNHQEFTSTAHKLNIMTTHEKFEVDKEVWQLELEEEFEDVRDEYEDEYATKVQEYRSKMKEWTEGRKRRKEKRMRKARKTKEGTAQKHDDEDEDEDEEDVEEKRKHRKDESDDESDNSESSVPSLSSKPVLPHKFDPERTKSDILALFQDLKRLPGEPKISLELTKTVAITSKTLMPPNTIKELQRRKATERSKIEFKILFNKRELYTSPQKELSPDFSVFMGLTIPIKIRELPELLQLVITEISKSGHRTVISDVELPLPNRNTSIDRCHVQKIEFQTETVVKTNHAGVGSGVPFSTNKEDWDGIFTCGYITTRVGWSTDKDGNILCPPGYDRIKDKEDEANFTLNTRELFQSGDIQKWSQSIQLDPNDPKNSKWIDSVAKKIQRAQRRRSLALIDDGAGGDTNFDLDDDDSHSSRADSTIGEFDFCSLQDLENSPRFKLLYLRDEEIPEFKNLQMIPPFDKDISSRVFEEYEKRLDEDSRRKPGESSMKIRKRTVDDDGDYEFNRMERIKEIRIKVLKLFESSLKQITFDDVIVEEQIPDIGTLGLNIMTLFQPRRPLRPTRRERKRVQGSSLADTKLTLIVNIVRAFNLPMRKDTDVGLTTESVTGIPLSKKRTGSSAFPFSSYSTAKTFVEIWFQRNVCRTTTALGANPTWNQELQMNLVVPDNDYSQENLSKMDDLVYLLVYDEVAIDLLEDDRRRDTDIHQRLEKRWLGSITIPFSTLFTNGRIEGTFKLNSPTILLGYEAQGMSSNFVNPLLPSRSSLGSSINIKDRFNTSSSSQVNNQKNSFITLFMTLQPAIQKISTFKEESATGEADPDIRSHVKSWKSFLSKKFPDRNIKPFVMNIEGETILCTRYLKPIQPPESLINPDAELLKNMEDISHFVSLFPSVRDSTLGISDYSLWVTSDVFVSSIGGGIEDHAVLLACFFMYLQVPCWIVQGNAIPDGPTAYVVTTFKGLETDQKIAKHLKTTYLIWNPCSGEYYFANDNFCPLQKVWAMIGSNNMWANMSDHERPHQLDWDLTKSNVWKPLFSKQMDESKISTVQIADIIFKPADQNQANSLSQRLERHLKDTFMKWRKTSKTKWNRSAAGILRRLLPRLEEIKSGKSRTQPRAIDGSTVTDSVHSIISDTPSNFSEEHLMELRDVIATYQMTGFPLQQPYVNIESITESVYATGVHTIDTPNVEFAIAAYCRSYPAQVYSTWLYIAALHRRK